MTPTRSLWFPPRAFAKAGMAIALIFAVSACAIDGDRAQAQPPRPARMVSAGEHVAERNCAQCHALGEVKVSPLAEAPPFNALRAAYSRAEMEEVIRERMHIVHPRMPKLELDVDEIGEFLDYWESLRPQAARSASPT